MSNGCCISIDGRGLGTIGIADPHGEIFHYRVRLVPPGLSQWAAELERCDKDESRYLVRVYRGNRWECDCKAFEFRKRGVHDCKHTSAMRALRAWLQQLTEPMRETIHEQRSEAV